MTEVYPLNLFHCLVKTLFPTTFMFKISALVTYFNGFYFEKKINNILYKKYVICYDYTIICCVINNVIGIAILKWSL